MATQMREQFLGNGTVHKEGYLSLIINPTWMGIGVGGATYFVPTYAFS